MNSGEKRVLLKHGLRLAACFAAAVVVLLLTASRAAAQDGGVQDQSNVASTVTDGDGSAKGNEDAAGQNKNVPARNQGTVPPRGGSKGSGGAWLQTMLALGVVVVLVLAARALLKRRPGAALGGLRPQSRPMEVLARTSLTMRQELVLVRLGRRLVMVGVGPAGSQRLAEVTDPDEVAQLAANATSGGWGELLGLKKRQIQQAAGEDLPGPSEAQRLKEVTREMRTKLSTREGE